MALGTDEVLHRLFSGDDDSDFSDIFGKLIIVVIIYKICKR